MNPFQNLPYAQRAQMLGTTVLFSVIYMTFTTYSVLKYKGLENLSLVEHNVEMRIIQHGVRSVCPRCGSKGVPSCPQCKVEMYWNGYRGTFLCPACGEGGFPACPRCGEFMTWIEAK
ncbi:MAG: hypothetical protein HQL31_01770 [Planctomycetes bacterium]|nr:hypothetical protein [Planctomycetota bacterium]